MNRLSLSSAPALSLAALALAAAAVATNMLPTECGVVSRPNVDALAIVALAGGGFLLLGGIVAAIAGKLPNRTRRPLLGAALLEVVAWIAVLLFYLHQTGGSYPNCG